jgi:hypothetical protein
MFTQQPLHTRANHSLVAHSRLEHRIGECGAHVTIWAADVFRNLEVGQRTDVADQSHCSIHAELQV